MKPATRFLISGLILVIALTSVAAVGVGYSIDQAAQVRMLDRLKLAATVGADLQAQQLETLQLRAQLLAGDTALVDYVAQSLIPNPQRGGAVDSLSISDLLKERRQGYDIAMVLDAQGQPISASGLLEKDRASIQHDPLVTESISQLKPVQGAWFDHGELLWVVVSPLIRDNTLKGVLITATRVTDAFATSISHIARSDIALVAAVSTDSSPLPSSGLDVQFSDLLAKQSAQILAASETGSQLVPLKDGQQTVMAWTSPLRVSGGHVALVALDQSASMSHNLRAEGIPLLLGVIVLGVIAIVVVLLQWLRTWLPLQHMLEVVERAGGGDSFMTVRVKGSPIVQYMRDGINRLLHSQRS